MSSDVFTETWLYQDGKAEGRNEGRSEGKTEGALKALRTVFELRFPGVAFPALGAVSENTLEAALRAVVQASSAEEALAAIRAELRTAG